MREFTRTTINHPGWAGAGTIPPSVVRISPAFFAIPSIAADGRLSLLATVESLEANMEGCDSIVLPFSSWTC